MHSVMIVADEGSLEELNQLLAEQGWWISQISPGQDGRWLVVLTDHDPDASPFGAEEEDEEDVEEYELD